ncbi:unnamed protein product, partial [Caretta caretta]
TLTTPPPDVFTPPWILRQEYHQVVGQEVIWGIHLSSGLFSLSVLIYLYISPLSDVTCGAPPEVTNATIVNNEEGRYLPGARVQYKCQEGFESMGLNDVTCEDGEWSQPPTCQAQYEASGTLDFSGLEAQFEQSSSVNQHASRYAGLVDLLVIRKCPVQSPFTIGKGGEPGRDYF